MRITIRGTVLAMAALAALLIHVGVNLVKVQEVRKLAAFNEALVYAVTILGVVFINLLWGIGLGFGLALVLVMRYRPEGLVPSRRMAAELHEEGA